MEEVHSRVHGVHANGYLKWSNGQALDVEPSKTDHGELYSEGSSMKFVFFSYVRDFVQILYIDLSLTCDNVILFCDLNKN